MAAPFVHEGQKRFTLMFAIKSFSAPGITVNRPVTRLRKRIFEISFEEVTFERRGFNDSGRAARERLEHIGRSFLQGYHASLCDHAPEVLASNLEAVGREFSGFAYEGAAMGLTLLDQLSLRKRELEDRTVIVPGGDRSAVPLDDRLDD